MSLNIHPSIIARSIASAVSLCVPLILAAAQPISTHFVDFAPQPPQSAARQ